MQELSAIEPAAARFDLYRLHKFSFSMQDLALTNADITKRIDEAKKEFRHDGSVHVWSTFRIGNNIYVMNDKRGREIIDYLDARKYIILVKFIINIEDDIWIIRDKRESIQKSGNNIILGANSKPGILTGIDKPYYERSYPVTAVVYALYPLHDKSDVKLIKLT
ncbi:hypothetical protein CHS0354_024734 [Potamilus streckersoni]|uniref:Uncharacterized protein n=1 Tax=Potamilus streckersoni TaxID=2493646 RepID=A0AAE0RWX9_9BIVA|nr:hypothetical protein CHS0354_024734 [Potamilus streckersoni]